MTHPVRARHHAEMADGYLQAGALLDERLHLCYLRVSVLQLDAEDDALLFHQVHHLHHLVAEELLRQTGGRNLNAAESLVDEAFGLLTESLLPQFGHTETEESGRVALLDLEEVGVLHAVDEFLCDDGCRYLRIVHVRQEPLGGVLAVSHIGRQHLALLAKEQRAAAVRLQLVNGRTVHYCVLVQP